MRSGRALIGLIVSTVILLGLVILFTVGPSAFGQKKEDAVPARKDGKGTTIVGRATYAAKDDVCRQQLGQVRQAVIIGTDPVEETKPQSLEELRLGSTITSCPIGKEPYQYDPSTGNVKCPHPGHEKF